MSILNIGTSALTAAQTALSTTSNNISNINTEGYTRQRAEQVTRPANYEGNFYLGSGVTVNSVERIYDSFLATQVRSYTSQEAQQDSFLSYSRQVDNLLGSSELGINGGLDAFFGAVQEVANDPTSISARKVMLTEGELLASRFNTLDSQLTQLTSDVDNDIAVGVDDINNITRGIAELNQAILEAEGAKGSPNDLLDKRDQLINKLSEYVSVTTVPQSNGTVNIFVGNGQGLVVGTTQVDLNTISDSSFDPPRLNIGFGSTQTDITNQITGGSLGGALQFRNNIIDNTRAELDLLAESIVTAFNTAHSNGFDLDGNAGGNFFDPTGTTAADINVVLTDPRQIAASSGTNIGTGNNENALALADLQTDNTLVQVSAGPPPVTRSLADQYGVIVSDVATRTRQAEVSQETQQALLQQTKQRFDSVSGVNLDEEAADLIKYQQAYQAASQIIVVSNTIFDTLINAV
ncbi:MAG: flagellar hook-associated protein FlgK [Methylophaga sp.]|jgi:flagellar hook-associated protein 1 FlgK|nr:flagellar hook-associated protein FlgK [Methylophaga sp.]